MSRDLLPTAAADLPWRLRALRLPGLRPLVVRLERWVSHQLVLRQQTARPYRDQCLRQRGARWLSISMLEHLRHRLSVAIAKAGLAIAIDDLLPLERQYPGVLRRALADDPVLRETPVFHAHELAQNDHWANPWTHYAQHPLLTTVADIVIRTAPRDEVLTILFAHPEVAVRPDTEFGAPRLFRAMEGADARWWALAAATPWVHALRDPRGDTVFHTAAYSAPVIAVLRDYPDVCALLDVAGETVLHRACHLVESAPLLLERPEALMLESREGQTVYEELVHHWTEEAERYRWHATQDATDGYTEWTRERYAEAQAILAQAEALKADRLFAPLPPQARSRAEVQQQERSRALLSRFETLGTELALERGVEGSLEGPETIPMLPRASAG